MKALIFDIETDGFLDRLTKIHSLVIVDADTSELKSYADQPGYASIDEGLQRLSDADVIVGHNIISFDIPAIKKVKPQWTYRGIVRDTHILSRLLWPSEHLKEKDFVAAEKHGFPKNQIGNYTLEAWGYRLGNYKGDYAGPWDTWSQEMQDYGEQDGRVTIRLWAEIVKQISGWGLNIFDADPPPGKDAVELEHRVAWIVTRQERRGFAFNKMLAQKLYATLMIRQNELAAELARTFPPRVVRTPFTPKANNKTKGWVKGETIEREKVVLFNPGSRPQVAKRLQEMGWEPIEFTDNGTPKVDDDILRALPYPEAKLLGEYYMIEKRLGQLGDGRQALLKHERNGRIHGRVITNGAVTGRMTHSSPNIAQVPGLIDKKTGEPMAYGKEFRGLFGPGPGYVEVGCDADALELRCLGAFMSRYDQGAYIRTILEGRKEDGTDMHSVNAKALGGVHRETAKKWFYAFIYGAGDWKLGFILTGLRSPRNKIARIGRESKDNFLKGLPAMGKLIKAVKRVIEGVKDRNGATVVAGRNYLVGIDGRRVFIRGAHAALNTLLQSAGALLMKRAQVLLDEEIEGYDFEFVATIHDEWQIEARPHLAEAVGMHATDAIKHAGEFYSFACPLKGNFVVGNSWAECH